MPSHKPPRDDETPVQGVPIHEPIETIAHRTRATATDAKNALNTVSLMREELAGSIKRDEVEHKRLSDGLVSVNSRLDLVCTEVSAVKVMSSKADGQLDLLVDDMKRAKDIGAVGTKAAIEDAADAKKNRRALNLKIVAIITAAVTTLTTALTVLINRLSN